MKLQKFLPLIALANIILTTRGALAVGYTSTAVTTTGLPFTDIGSLITVLVGTIIIVAGLASFLFLILGGFQYLTSGGDKAQAQSARDRITYALMGLVIIVAAIAIANILGAVFGINILGNIKFPGPASTIGN